MISNPTLKVNDDQLFWMFRYCIGRSSYAVQDGVDAVIYNWHNLEQRTKDLIIKEIQEEISGPRQMYQCDIDAWKTVLRYAEKEEYR